MLSGEPAGAMAVPDVICGCPEVNGLSSGINNSYLAFPLTARSRSQHNHWNVYFIDRSLLI